jgi:hypothetical protein
LITCTHVYYRQGIGISTIPLLKYYIAWILMFSTKCGGKTPNQH